MRTDAIIEVLEVRTVDPGDVIGPVAQPSDPCVVELDLSARRPVVGRRPPLR